MRNRLFLIAAFALAFMAGGALHAQESMNAPPAATSDLPFVNNGANEPVLQPLSPDGAPVEEHAGEEGHKKGLPQFDVSTFPRQIFWLVLTFVFLYVFFARKTLPTIGSVLEKRQARIEGDLSAAEGLKAQVERVRSDYEAAVAKSQSDAQKLIADMQADSKKTLEQREAGFKTRAEEATAQLEMKLNAERARAVGELNNLAAELAADITTRLAGVRVDAGQANAAVDAQTNRVKAA